MASIFTGLAFMHGHIVDRELVLRLGRDDGNTGGGRGATTRQAAPARRADERKASNPACAGPACANC